MDGNDTIAAYRPWLYKTATGLLNPQHPELEDLVQEGRIAMWQALGTHDPDKGALPAWLTARARWRMTEAVTQRNWSGKPARRDGRHPVAFPAVLSLDASRGDGITLADLLPDDGDVLESVLNAYHHGEIYDAICSLAPKQREYVYARFWKQLTTSEMKAEIFGYDPSALWNSPKNGAKKKLAEKLAEMVAEQ
jgi:RNA polymerase sigma factor (sigma-70 family)